MEKLKYTPEVSNMVWWKNRTTVNTHFLDFENCTCGAFDTRKEGFHNGVRVLFDFEKVYLENETLPF